MSEEVARQKPGPDAKLDDAETRNEFIALVSRGLSMTDAYEYVGVSHKAVWHYRQSHPEFERELKRALLKSKIHHLGIIHAGSTGTRKAKTQDGKEVEVEFGGDWKASAWYLARRWPEEFAERQKHELSGPNGGPIQSEHADLSKLNVDELRQLRELRNKMKPDDEGEGGETGPAPVPALPPT